LKQGAPLESNRNKGGRPTKYNENIAASICADIQYLLSEHGAAYKNGINPDTLYEWKKVHPEFSDQVKKAQAIAEEQLLAELQAGGKDWQRWAWLLERKFKAEYGIKQQLEHSGSVSFTLPKQIDENNL
jgi:hypothetical protein